MTGAWARECDRYQYVRVCPSKVVYYIAAQIDDDEGANYICEAGAFLRAWRQSLPDQGERRCDMTGTPTGRLLWIALQDVGRAQFWTAKDPSIAAFNLRGAESALRTWWKRSRS